VKNPSQIAEEYLLSIPGLTDNDKHMVAEYLEILPEGHVRADRLNAHLQGTLQPYILKVNRWMGNLPFQLAYQIKGASVHLAELACPIDEVWIPKGWAGGMTYILGLQINTWDRPTIRITSEARYGRFTDCPFDFVAMGNPNSS